MAYRNGGHQVKRIGRKLGEVSFDVEALREYLRGLDYNQAEEWEQVIGEINTAIAYLTGAKELAESTLKALKDDPLNGDTPKPTKPADSEAPNPANPFAKPKPSDPKQKGG